jgi:alkylation response protein AidB-like acyl-CoA dehydrogenase
LSFRGCTQNGNLPGHHLYLAAAFCKKPTCRRVGGSQPVTTIYGGTSEIMKTIIAREVTGLRT